MRLQYDGIAICDVNGLYGVVRGYQAAHQPSHFVASVSSSKEFRYLMGAELTLIEGVSVVLTPMNLHGYSELCSLLTQGKRQARKGFSRLSLGEVSSAVDCLVYLLPPWSLDVYDRCEKAFGDRLYLPVWKDLTWESLRFYQQALLLEEQRGARLFVTQRPLMHDRWRKPVFDVLTCALHRTTIFETVGAIAPNGERCLRPLSELRSLWKDRPDLIRRTREIAARVKFSLSEIKYRYPEGFLPDGLTSTDYLRRLTEEGLQWRFPDGIPEKVHSMVEHELSVIRDLRYEDYFLTLREICDFARARGILYQGRGSAANSVVCYALGLTAVSPDRIDMLFERFISRERGEPPDIDIDFEHERREEVIQHIYQKYGADHAAMVCNVIRFRGRSAFRETARAFGLSTAQVNRIVAFMGRDGLRRLQETPEQAQEFGVDHRYWIHLLRVARELVGFPRHLGIHTGGFIITQNPLFEMVPVEKATMTGRYVVQWNKDDVNTLGLMKIDLLSLGMLTCLRKSFDLLMKHKNSEMSLASIPEGDEATYQMIGRAETVGVFQIESRAQMQTLPRMKPRNFYDLVVEVAIVRPGPLQGGMVHPYLRRRQGLEPVVYPHPDLEPVLAKTKGVPLFQEQIMQIAVVGAGFSPGEADELRRIMSAAWRRKGVMDGVRERILRGLREKGLSPEYAEQVYRTIEGFASYGFPESHAASFALLTYASSYLKRHHPEVFLCALLNSQPMGFYPARSLIQEAQQNGVEVFDVDINFSSTECLLEGKGARKLPVRLGFQMIRGFSQEWGRMICVERERRGGFSSLTELVRRVALPRAALSRLAAAGAFASWEIAPRDLLWRIQAMELDPGHLFFASESAEEVVWRAENSWEEVLREYEVKGYSVERHPLSVLRPRLGRALSARDLRLRKHGERVEVVGLLGLTQRPPTAKGFCFITLEDENGFVNVVIPPRIYERDRLTIYQEKFLRVRGVLEKNGDVTNLKASEVRPLFTASRLVEPRSDSGR